MRDGKLDQATELAAELVRLNVDIIVVAGGDRMDPGGQECDQDDSHRYDGPVGPILSKAGCVESLARPGGNVTGLTNLTGELGGKRLELLKEAVPKLVRVAVLYDPASPGSILEVKEVLPVAARALGLTIQPWEVRAADDFETGIRCAEQAAPGWTLCDLQALLMGCQRKTDRGLCDKEPVTVDGSPSENL